VKGKGWISTCRKRRDWRIPVSVAPLWPQPDGLMKPLQEHSSVFGAPWAALRGIGLA